MRFVKIITLSTLGACAVSMPLTAAVAQGSSAEENGDEASSTEIVVTARKREERISDVPIAISAFTGDQLREQGVSSIADISNIAAGVVLREDVAGRASPSIVIRGIGFDDFRSNGNPAVAVNIDQVYLGSNALISGAIFDVERIEIAKGPQGTLYGRNTTAGALNVISRQPSDSLSANFDAEYGSFRYFRTEAGIGGPINDSVGFRIAATYERGGGFLTNRGTAGFAGLPVGSAVPPLPLVPETNNVGDADLFAARGILTLRLGEGTTLTAQLNHARDRGDNSQSDVLGISATGFTEPDTDPFTFFGNILPELNSDMTGGQLRLDQELGENFSLTAIGAHIDLDRRYTFDPGDPRRRFDLEYQDQINQTTGEIRVQGRLAELADLTVGAFYFRDRVDLASLLDASDLVRTVIGTDYRQRRESWAVFGEVDWRLASDVTLTTGLRYTDETAQFAGSTVDLNPFNASVAAAAFRLPVVFDNDFSDSNLSGRIALSYRPAPGALIYGSVSRGFKSGGFDGSTIFSPGEALPFSSEQVDAYEVGLKLLGNRPVTITATAFYYDFKDLQANSVRQIGPVSTAVRTNVAQATVYGGEFELVARPTRGMRLGASIAYLKTKVDNFVSDSPAEVARRNGNELPDSPQLSMNLDARYAMEMGSGWRLEPQVSFNFTGQHWKEIDNFIPVEEYGLLNLRVALRSPDNRWNLAVFGRNVTDQVYFVGIIPAVTGAGVVTGQLRTVGAPATWGISFGLNY